jgi:predicted MFS family arabinose efflux permease
MSLIKGVKEIGFALNDQDHLSLFSLAFFWCLSWMMSLQWMTPYFINVFHASQKELGIFLTYLGVSWLIGGSLVNRYLIQYCRSIQLLFYSALVTVIIFACVPWCYALWLFYLCYGVLTLCGAVAWSNLNNVISLSAGPQDQGKIMGINQAVIALGEILGPVIGGFLILVSQGSIFLTCSALTLAMLFILYFEKKRFIPRS